MRALISTIGIAGVALPALPAMAEVDPCLLGTWHADVSGFQESYQANQSLGTVTQADGLLSMTIASDGTVVILMSDMRLVVEAGGMRIANVGNGGFFGTLDVVEDRLRASLLDARVIITAVQTQPDGTSQKVGEQINRLEDLGPSEIDAAYTCGPETLETEPAGWGVDSVRLWQRHE